MATYTVQFKNARGMHWQIKGFDPESADAEKTIEQAISKGIMSSGFHWWIEPETLKGFVFAGWRTVAEFDLVEEVTA